MQTQQKDSVEVKRILSMNIPARDSSLPIHPLGPLENAHICFAKAR